MACKIGITTDIKKTKTKHKETFEGFHSWQVMKAYISQNHAESWVKMFSSYHNCEECPNEHEASGEANWLAYHFYHN